MTQPPQKNLNSGKALTAYIQHLRKVSAENFLQPKRKQSDQLPPRETLETQIQRWWESLPPAMQQRRFQITEIGKI